MRGRFLGGEGGDCLWRGEGEGLTGKRRRVSLAALPAARVSFFGVNDLAATGAIKPHEARPGGYQAHFAASNAMPPACQPPCCAGLPPFPPMAMAPLLAVLAPLSLPTFSQ